MKEYTHSYTITFGMVLMAVVAGYIGNTVTAVLAGILAACAGTYLASLWWASKQDIRAAQKRTRTVMSFDGATFAKKVAGMVGSLLATIWKTCRMLYLNESGCRRIVYLAVAGILYASGLFVLMGFVFSPAEASLESLGLLGAVMLLRLVAIMIIVFALAALIAAALLIIDLFEGIGMGGLDDLGPFISEWFNGVVGDDRKPLASVLYMLAIRTGNVLKMFLWVFLFTWFVLRTLYTRKTAAATATSGLLAALELGICYRFNWIAYTNTNFWLALIVAIFIGAGIGRKIYDLQLPAPGWPVIHWFRHLPKAAYLAA